MAVSDVSIPQDGGEGNVKLHPYLITLVRWCVSCLWSTATVLLHRLLTTPLPPITAASKQPPRPVPRSRQAGTEHLHPEPRVECVVLHTPPTTPTLDVIFVHGLYGSLGNTWRQGEWKTKYKLDPTRVPLRNHPTDPCNCAPNKERPYNNLQEVYAYETNLNETALNENVTYNHINGCFKKILPNENSLITEKFYNNTVIRVDVENYETQAKFVSELFKNDCDKNCDLNTFKCKFDENGLKCNCEDRSDMKCHSDNCKCKLNEQFKLNECQCKLNVGKEGACVAGCGCVCDECYSPCWPRDWIKEDFPGARVISINYTSDPYLWRPLWVKGNKRLRLHERAEQMMSQLLELGVGRRPIVWVGHSKGGLFIKQIYCEAYEAYLNTKNQELKNQNIINNNSEGHSNSEYNIVNNDTINNKNNIYYNDNDSHTKSKDQNNDNSNNLLNNFMQEHRRNGCIQNGETTLRNIDEMNEIRNNNNSGDNIFNEDDEDLIINDKDIDNNCNIMHDSDDVMTEMFDCARNDAVVVDKQARCNETEYDDIRIREDDLRRRVEDDTRGDKREVEDGVLSSNHEEDSEVPPVCSLWSRSAGFMFYSVPHRGSPLADIKTPITCRSVELQEIAKDCPLVVQLQSRWLAAARPRPAGPRPAGPRPPRVRSLVETGRTLMSVLWLRIVSEDSADAGVGSLHGISVDHREICKPSSRTCMLYTELTDLIHAALNKCDCQ